MEGTAPYSIRMSTPLSRAVARFVRRRRLWGADDRIAVAVSGGSDSVALAFITRDLERLSLGRPAGLIHVNHQLRGAESDADEAFCRALAARLGWPIEVARVDVARRARERRQSMEAAAREARYACFERAAVRLNATVVVTGHTADDQAETVLLRLLRGAGTRGLSGIRARRGLYARPLLESRRSELRRDLARRGETFREDASNLDVAIPRNRLRRDLMPVVEQIAPGGVRALARLAGLAEDDEAALEGAAIEMARTVVLSRVGDAGRTVSIDIDAAALSRLPPAIGRRVVRALVREMAPESAPRAVHLQAIWSLVRADKPKGHLDLAGFVVRRRGGVISLVPAGGDRPTAGLRTGRGNLGAAGH
jgi:tRNA(Ile)-lysidine synthase